PSRTTANPDNPDRGTEMSAFRSRGPSSGRILRPDDAFVLREEIPMPGAYPVADAIDEVAVEWRRQATVVGNIAGSTVDTNCKVLNTLRKFAEARSLALVCDLTNSELNSWMFSANAYTSAPAAYSMTRLRRNVATSFFYTAFRIGITDANPATMLPTAKHNARHVAAFDEKKIKRLKQASEFEFRETKSPSALALALLGAAPGEVGSITCADVFLMDMLVRAHGGGTRYEERWLPIDDSWCFEKLSARISYLSVKHPKDWQNRFVAYEPRPGNGDDFARRSAATSTTLTKVIERAGLKKNGVLRVASIGEYVAQRIFEETGSLEAVAARLGINKLDTVARIVGYDWKTLHAVPGPIGEDQ
ncbi:MAG: hypothetical protein WCP28_18130, partial [Actinomycetes bacterium]